MNATQTKAWPESGKFFATCSDGRQAHKGYFVSLWAIEHFECGRHECNGFHRIHKASEHRKLG